MKFGMPTLVECRDINECAAVAAECGLDFIEVNMSFPQYQPQALDANLLCELAKKHGIGYTIHADEMLNPFDFNDKVSGCYFEVIKDTISFAKKIGASVINMHLLKGVYVTLPDKVVLLNDVYFDNYIEKVRQFVKMCENEIGNSDIKICIENVDSNQFTEAQIKALDLMILSDAFALTLDTGHEYCLGFKDSHIYDKYRHKLIHLHLHDAVGKSAHLALGDGEVDIKGSIARLPCDNTCLIEVKTIDGLKKSINYLKKTGVLS